MAKFPKGTTGLALDMLARQPLWQDGLEYGHGTGHGIGAYLNVHEGPMGIGGGSVPGDAIQKNAARRRMYLYGMEPGARPIMHACPRCRHHPRYVVLGMYVSDEPGFYKAGEFGMRLESDLIVEEVSPPLGVSLQLDPALTQPCRRQPPSTGSGLANGSSLNT